jgi:transposase
LINYIGKKYKGAIQSDGLTSYKILETDTYPEVIRLGCLQHCKRKFLDVEGDEDAKEIVDIINSLYRKEHETGKDWEPDKILKYRQQYAPPILEKLKKKLLSKKSDPWALPKSPLAMAVNYTLVEYDALCNYILRHDYKPDNNAIEMKINNK